jgi:hypothetical protein
MRNPNLHKRLLLRSLLITFLVLALVFIPVLANNGIVPISGLSPYPDGGDPNDPFTVTECNGAPQIGVVYRNSESEPYIAVNPLEPDNMIAAWHQDRWSTGGAQGLGAAYSFDGGVTWTMVNIPFTRCSGALPRSVGDFERASDPWVSFSPDGTAHYMALVFNDTISKNGMISATSHDGGVTWSDPVPIKISPAKDPVFASLFHDKNTLTADPFDPNLVYATWTLFRLGSTTLLFSRSTDGGKTWDVTRPINNWEKIKPAEMVVFRQGAQIVVLPDGTLVNAFFRLIFNQRTWQVTLDQAIFRSEDQGRHWEKMDTQVSDLFTAVAVDPELGVPVRDAGEIPDIAVNKQTGDLYITWQDTRYNTEGRVGVVVSRSTDGGSTWSEPINVNQNPSVQSFLPAVAVSDDGTVGVLFYDFRYDVLGDAPLSADVHLAHFDPDLTFRDEVRLTTNSFDFRQMLITGSRGYFPGDYVGLDSAGNDFVAAFTVTNDLGLPVEFPQDNSGTAVDSNNRQDIVFSRVTPP